VVENMKNKSARPLREDVDENPCGISLNSLRARQPKVFMKSKNNKERPGSYIPEKSLRHFSGAAQT